MSITENCRDIGRYVETLIIGRDSSFDVQPPKCPKCGQPIAFEEYRPWTVKALEGDRIASLNEPTI